MDTGQLQAAAQAFLAALNASSAAQYNALDQNRLNMNAQINNANNATGTLYSTRPAFQMAQFAASKYMPAYAKLTQQTETAKTEANNSLNDVLKKINDLNTAAAQLGG